MRKTDQAGIDLIKSFEGIPDGDPSTVNLDAYLDPIGIWTIGWGHAIVFGNDFLRESVPVNRNNLKNKGLARSLYPGGITLAEAEDLLRADLGETEREIEYLVKVDITDNQFAALVSFAFNVGAGNLRKSTLLRRVNQGKMDLAVAEFDRWNKAGGKVLSGLTRRRAAEAALFSKP